MPVRFEDLPAKTRAQVRAANGLPKKPKPSSRTGDGQPCAGRCGCGAAFDRYTRWERHADAEHHSRWSVDLDQLKPA